MSRAINLKLDEAVVVAKCREAGVGIISIEGLLSGGARLVCSHRDGANEIRLM